MQESSQFTPFFIVHAHDPILACDTLLCPKLRSMGEQYVPTMLGRLHEAYKMDKHNMQQSRDKNK